MNTDNIDKFGHCVVCHKNLITKRIVDGIVQEMFLPIHDHAEFMLDNGSLMKVCMCKPCKESTDLTDATVQDNIMQAVRKGWELEVAVLVADDKQPVWTKEYGENYLNVMGELNIDSPSEGIDKNAVQEKQKKLFIAKSEVILSKMAGVRNGIG